MAEKKNQSRDDAAQAADAARVKCEVAAREEIVADYLAMSDADLLAALAETTDAARRHGVIARELNRRS